MDKKYLLIGAVAVLLILGAAAGYYILVYAPNNATLKHVDDLHMKMSASSLGELETIIQGSTAAYTRERAVTVYSDIASRSGNTPRAMTFLKDVATKEADDNVRSSAYTSYYWLQETAGIPPKTSVETRVQGDIKPGSNVTVLLIVKSERGSELASVSLQARNPQEPTVTPAPDSGTRSVVIVDANSGKGAQTNVYLTPSNRIRKPLPANVSVEFPYTVSIREPGKVVLQSVVEVRYDRLDYDTVKGNIYLDVGTNGGTYFLG
jgi:hypothetical protein